MSSQEDEEEEISKQLHATLHDSVRRSLSSRRPLLTHLNADTTWLLSLPHPESESQKKSSRRVYYHILIDPWLRGGQSDVAKFFSQQWHVEDSAVQTIAELEELIWGIEDAARGIGESVAATRRGVTAAAAAAAAAEESPLDAIIVSHEFTDHMHRETLLEAPPCIPVFAATKAASAIRSWGHFDSVSEVPRFTGDWRESSSRPLPDWVGISRVAYAGRDLLFYHSAVMVTFTLGSESEFGAEAVIYTPHGISPADLAPVAKAEPPVQTLALLHGLADISLGAQLNMGAHNGLKVLRLLQAKYWIGTHDELKKGGGVVSWFLDRKNISLKEAIQREREEKGADLKGGEVEGLSEVRFEDLRNGESLILE
ncbi:hypothetical protein LZ554_008163 [Drepanopeziza brunnea f. sp. 'monogermtubi']|nr:hypothetical protein LZ554_008163 [Drepanopeziza brunnea f. sp. 'monogermtubi']